MLRNNQQQKKLSHQHRSPTMELKCENCREKYGWRPPLALSSYAWRLSKIHRQQSAATVSPIMSSSNNWSQRKETVLWTLPFDWWTKCEHSCNDSDLSKAAVTSMSKRAFHRAFMAEILWRSYRGVGSLTGKDSVGQIRRQKTWIVQTTTSQKTLIDHNL